MKVLPGLPQPSVIKALAVARGFRKHVVHRKIPQYESPFLTPTLRELRAWSDCLEWPREWRPYRIGSDYRETIDGDMCARSISDDELVQYFMIDTRSSQLRRLERRIRDHCAVNEETGCLEYQGGLGAGYGRVKWNGKLYGAHRLMAFCAGIIDRIAPGPDRYVLHSCDNRKCCNPDHLRRGTQSENMREAHSKKARPLLPKQG